MYLRADNQDSVCSLGPVGHPAHGAKLGDLSLLPEVHGHAAAAVLLEELSQSHHRLLEGRALSRVHQQYGDGGLAGYREKAEVPGCHYVWPVVFTCGDIYIYIYLDLFYIDYLWI